MRYNINMKKCLFLTIALRRFLKFVTLLLYLAQKHGKYIELGPRFVPLFIRGFNAGERAC